MPRLDFDRKLTALMGSAVTDAVSKLSGCRECGQCMRKLENLYETLAEAKEMWYNAVTTGDDESPRPEPEDRRPKLIYCA